MRSSILSVLKVYIEKKEQQPDKINELIQKLIPNSIDL